MVVGVHNVEITCTVKCYVIGVKHLSILCTATVTLETRVSTLPYESGNDATRINLPDTTVEGICEVRCDCGLS